MKRSLFVGAVWLLVTAASILVAYAAVGEVRNRVVEQPRLTPIAASTGTSAVPTETTPATDDPTTTTTTSIAATSTSLATTTTSESVVQTTSTSSAPATTTTTSAEGRIETYSTPGGSVSIEIFPDRLRLLGAVPAAGFSVAEQEISPTKIEIEFKSSNQEVTFHAELHSDGEVETQVETENE